MNEWSRRGTVPQTATTEDQSDSLLVRLRDVTRTVEVGGRAITLLAPVSIDLHGGSLVAVAGPSGSGKTTLCNIIVGWERPDAGSVMWTERATPTAEWWRVSVAPQRLALDPAMTLHESMCVPFWATHRPVPADGMRDVCASLAIDHLMDRRPGEVSFGEQQRAAVARALLGGPELAVLDEPTGHQDEARAALVIEQLVTTSAAGTCVLVATHDERIIDIANHVVRLR